MSNHVTINFQPPRQLCMLNIHAKSSLWYSAMLTDELVYGRSLPLWCPIDQCYVIKPNKMFAILIYLQHRESDTM